MSPSLEYLHGQALVSATFDDDTNEWLFMFSGQASLRVGAPWRVVSRGNIVLGSADNGERFGLSSPVDAAARLKDLIVDSRVNSTKISASGDLAINFGSLAVLDIFNASCGYEGWQLFGPGSKCVVAQGGGKIVESTE